MTKSEQLLIEISENSQYELDLAKEMAREARKYFPDVRLKWDNGNQTFFMDLGDGFSSKIEWRMLSDKLNNMGLNTKVEMVIGSKTYGSGLVNISY